MFKTLNALNTSVSADKEERLLNPPKLYPPVSPLRKLGVRSL
jgi:hypothetical protein